MNLTFSSRGDQLYRGQWDGWITARISEREEPVGELHWQSWKDDDDVDRYRIAYVEVDPEFRRQGIATAMYKKLFEQEGITSKDLEGATLTPEGAAFREGAQLEENPPWVDSILNRNFDAIVARVGIERMPVPEALKPGKKRKIFKEYGVGHYGAVYPTATPGIVFKVSSDPTEAMFIAADMSLSEDDRLAGIVRYYGVWETEEKHRRRPVYIILREEAENVGGLLPMTLLFNRDQEMRTKASSVIRHLAWFKEWANIARTKINAAASVEKMVTEVERLSDWAEDQVDYGEITDVIGRGYGSGGMPSWLRGAQAAAYAIRAAQIVAEDMVNEDVGYLVGEALGFYLEQGLLLADVHGNNVGQVRREDYSNPIWVITDPGHAFPIKTKWLGTIEVPRLVK